MRRLITVVALVLLLLLPPGTALAHGFGQRYDLPVPLWLYLYGAAGTVVLSFLLVGLFVGEQGHDKSGSYRRYNLLGLGWFRRIFAGKVFITALRLISVALFLLVIVSGLFGLDNPSRNFAPTFVWVIWWVGLSFFTALFGNLWELVNPWKILFEWFERVARRLGFENDADGGDSYPPKWGIWPALILYVAFVWIEIIYEGAPTPFNIALIVLAYSVLTWGGMVLYGKSAWLRHGEAFSVFFSILAKFAPTEVRVTNTKLCRDCDGTCPTLEAGEDCVNCYECFARARDEDRELNLRPWAVGLLNRERVTTDRLAFVIFMLSSVTFDGLAVTPLWENVTIFAFPFFRPLGQVGYVGFQTLGLLGLASIFLALYFGFSTLIRLFGGSKAEVKGVAGAFIYSLVPIALAYQVAHYFTFLLVQGQSIFALISDPLGKGWNLFGTALYETNVGIVSAGYAWYTQVAVIVVGHMVAVYLAHRIALRFLGDRRRAMRSQYPMLALMVLYTISSLWILSQPVVQESALIQESSTHYVETLTAKGFTPLSMLGNASGLNVQPPENR